MGAYVVVVVVVVTTVVVFTDGARTSDGRGFEDIVLDGGGMVERDSEDEGQGWTVNSPNRPSATQFQAPLDASLQLLHSGKESLVFLSHAHAPNKFLRMRHRHLSGPLPDVGIKFYRLRLL